jgi:hypothetical protein
MFQHHHQPSQDQHDAENQSQGLSDYQVVLSSGECVYILAADSEEAAWLALELSDDNNTKIVDVIEMGKKYFPNNWQRFKDVPADDFETISYDDFMDWKVAGWEINSSYNVIIRATNLENSKVVEHVYKRQSAAEGKIQEYLNSLDHELVICTHDKIYYVHPEMFDDDD